MHAVIALAHRTETSSVFSKIVLVVKTENGTQISETR